MVDEYLALYRRIVAGKVEPWDEPAAAASSPLEWRL
jgi:hypothetical protein